MEKRTLQPTFWDDRKRAEETYSQLNTLKDSYEPWKELIEEIDDLVELVELYADEPDNPEEQDQVDDHIAKVAKKGDLCLSKVIDRLTLLDIEG